jgi:hypothetical protein
LIDGQKYFYRICAKDLIGQLSEYSPVISAIPSDSVAPKAPKNVTNINIIKGSAKIVWESNKEIDLEGYNIYKSNSKKLTKKMIPIGTTIKGFKEFIDLNLDLSKPFYYSITAFDEVPNESEFSEIILGPFPPTINNSIKEITIVEDTIDDFSINLYHCFKDINNDSLSFWCEGQDHINVVINQSNGHVQLIPENDWNGKEMITFCASDGVWNISDTVEITITPINDPPESVVILSPQNNITINETTPINFKATCYDPDLYYGDNLIFIWSSNISGKIGMGNNISRIIHKPGYHEIKVIVTDLENLSSFAKINIFVLLTNISSKNQTNLDEPDKENDQKSDFISSITIFLISASIVVIIIILFLLILRKKYQNYKGKNDKKIIKSDSETTLGRQTLKTEGELITDNNNNDNQSL